MTLTHDPKLDDPAIAAALRAPVFYLGCLGSTRTHAKRVERLGEAGFDDRRRSRASTRRSAPTSARSRRPRSPSRSSPRSPSGCAGRRPGPEMRFGPVPPAEAEGAVLAHSLAAGRPAAAQGPAARPPPTSRRCVAAGVAEVTVARLEPGDRVRGRRRRGGRARARARRTAGARARALGAVHRPGQLLRRGGRACCASMPRRSTR